MTVSNGSLNTELRDLSSLPVALSSFTMAAFDSFEAKGKLPSSVYCFTASTTFLRSLVAVSRKRENRSSIDACRQLLAAALHPPGPAAGQAPEPWRKEEWQLLATGSPGLAESADPLLEEVPS
eukprot:GHVT01050425.1.p3 GENE.GHVT01050425.1~~GHVT01050425.1.p3  ORF type:complete len:123 (-),score=16.95 GHVT01050425.1:152-520(-)